MNGPAGMATRSGTDSAARAMPPAASSARAKEPPRNQTLPLDTPRRGPTSRPTGQVGAFPSGRIRVLPMDNKFIAIRSNLQAGPRPPPSHDRDRAAHCALVFAANPNRLGAKR